MISQKTLDEILFGMERLPELPAVALQINRMMDDPQTGAQDLAKIIMLDPYMTSKVLRLCNSATYGFARRIATISEAVSILGYRELKQIVFSIISHSFLDRPIQGYSLEKGALWQNAITCGTYARHIAKKINYKDRELVFIGSLLRDVGKVALSNYLIGKEEILNAVVLKEKCSFDEAEEMVVGINHTEIGKELALRWHLPDSLVHTIGFHHHPTRIPDSTPRDIKTLVALVHLADTYTMMTGTGVGIDGLMYPLDAKIFELLPIRIDNGELEVLYSELLSLQDEINMITNSFK